MTKNTEQIKSTWGSGGLLGGESFRNLGSLLIMLSSPPFAIVMWHCCYNLDGNISDLFAQMLSKGASNFIMGGWYDFLAELWPSPFDPVAWKLILSFMALQLALMRIVPGPEFKGFSTATGHIPVYTDNGVPCYLITVAIVFVLYFTGAFDPAIVYDKMGNILSSMNLFSIFFCFFLSFKGVYFPSTRDCGSNGNLIADVFWGTELYPRIFGWDVKQFTNCRFGMMYWQVGIICYAFKQYSTYGFLSGTMLVSVLVQSVYIFKFFWWETGYFCSMDIQHDRAGFMLCWGCMVWVPSVYTLHTYFWATHPYKLSLPYTVLLLVIGLFAVWLNYDCDRYSISINIKPLSHNLYLILICFEKLDSARSSVPRVAR